MSVHDACGNSNGCAFNVIVRRPTLGPITYTRTLTTVVLSWTDGILQSTTNLLVPFTDVAPPPPVTSPYTVSTVPPAPVTRYFRLRCASP